MECECCGRLLSAWFFYTGKDGKRYCSMHCADLNKDTVKEDGN